jgi:hypothetical protein
MLGDIRADPARALPPTASLYSADVQGRELQMDKGPAPSGFNLRSCEMRENNEMISRRRAFSLLGLAAALGFALPAEVLTTPEAEAQQPAPPAGQQPAPAGQPAAPAEGGTAGSKRRKKRRTHRKERRKKRHGGGEATQQQK